MNMHKGTTRWANRRKMDGGCASHFSLKFGFGVDDGGNSTACNVTCCGTGGI